MTKTYDVVAGEPVEDLACLSREELIARKRECESRLGEINRSGLFLDELRLADSARANARRERERLKALNDAVDRRLRELRQQQKEQNMRRNFAGLQSPLWEAVRALCPDRVAQLESEALRRLDARMAEKGLT